MLLIIYNFEDCTEFKNSGWIDQIHTKGIRVAGSRRTESRKFNINFKSDDNISVISGENHINIAWGHTCRINLKADVAYLVYKIFKWDIKRVRTPLLQGKCWNCKSRLIGWVNYLLNLCRISCICEIYIPAYIKQSS